MSGGIPVCVGREPALAVLREQLAVAVGGAARIVWIDGEPGMGKTTLVRAFLAETRHKSAWVSGDEDETSLPYGVLGTLLRAIEVAAGVGATGEALPSVLTDPLAAGAELLVALGGLDVPLVMVVDDLQWADLQSASALRFALRRLLAERVVVVLVTRPEAVDVLGEQWGRLLADSERVTRLHLDGLSTDGMVELLAATGHGRLDRPVAERLSGHTGGNPLHARALIDELGASGLLAGRVLPAPRSFAQLTVGRLAAMDVEAVQLTTAGAVLGSRFPTALAASLGKVSDPSSALDRAVEAKLLERASDGEARFPHPLVRAAIYNDIPARQLRALHQAAAAETEGVRSLEHQVAATHGSDDALAAKLERRAIKEWLVSGRGSVAYGLFMDAARLSSESPDRDRRTLIAVEALFSSGDFGRAYAMTEAVMGCAPSAHRSWVLGMIDKTPGAEAHFSAAAAQADDKTDIPMLRLRAIGGRSVVHLRQGRFEAALADANTAMAPGIDGWASGLMRWVQVVSLANLGRSPEAWDVLDQQRQSNSSGFELDVLCTRGLLELVDDELPAAVEDLTALAERARAGETCRLLEFALSALALAQYWLGRWDESALNSQLAISLHGEGQVALAHSISALVHAGRGRFDVADADIKAAEDANRVISTAGGPYYVSIAKAALAQGQGQQGDLREATAPLLDGSIQPTVEGFDRWGWRVLAIEGLVAAGELPAAREQLTALVNLVRTNGLSSATTDIARLEGQLAEASGDLDAALARYEAGLHSGSGLVPLPLPAARLALAYGSLLRRTGSRRAAIEQLRNAHAGLTALGAAPFLAACDAELSACGLQAPTADRSGRLRLTPTEQTVAHLIAQGLTNREAATRLYVSPKTVDYHLGNIYAKLGITSRRDLPGRLKIDA